MTSERLGEMFKGDSADTYGGKFPLVLMGDERTVKRAQTVSEDPHRREWNIVNFLKFVQGLQNLRYDFGGLGEVFEVDSADTCAEKFPLVLMGR